MQLGSGEQSDNACNNSVSDCRNDGGTGECWRIRSASAGLPAAAAQYSAGRTSVGGKGVLPEFRGGDAS
eukprot:758163-Pleurochrysis_carterae.AAC.1